MTYLEEIRVSVAQRHTEAELCDMYFKGTGKPVPDGVGIRDHVSRWHADQQAINAGGEPTELWKSCV